MFAAITIEPYQLLQLLGGAILCGVGYFLWAKKPNEDQIPSPPREDTPEKDSVPEIDEEESVDPNSPEAVAELWASLQYVDDWLHHQKNTVAQEHLANLRKDLFVKEVPPSRAKKPS